MPGKRSSALRPATSKKGRRYNFACRSCKSRKVKCCGTQPTCSGCQRSGEECVWPPTRSTESQLRDANARIRDLEASHYTSSIAGSRTEPRRPSMASSSASGRAREVATSTTGPSPGSGTEASPASNTNQPGSASSLWFQLGIGENGGVTYNGPTSRFHAVSLEENQLEDEPAMEMPDPGHVETLHSQYALMDSVWLPLIAAKPVMGNTGVDTNTGMTLLDIYWTWLHPLHNCVYCPSLVMDLALGGPYCSDFLLMCIFGLAARHLPEQHLGIHGINNGEHFIIQAKKLLLEEMSRPTPSIPTIQGLLILSGRQCATGRSSEGWLYTGMAIRMMQDTGLHLDTTTLARLERWTPAEIETRKRLYNSAYIWDKTLSLALGRPPTLTRAPCPSKEILDKFDDERLWRPIHASEIIETFSPSPAWNTSTFCAFCSLHEITTNVMMLFSNTERTESFPLQIEELDAQFQQWYRGISTPLKIDDTASMEQSPPPHIVSLK